MKIVEVIFCWKVKGDLWHHVEDLAADASVEKEKETETEATAEEACFRGSFQAGAGSNSLIRKIKKRLTVQRHAIAALWDADRGAYVSESRAMASVLKASAHQRQGRDLGDSNKGQRFLDGWGVDLSASRTQLGEAEMTEIILSSPMHKRPGPDGISGVVYKRNA